MTVTIRRAYHTDVPSLIAMRGEGDDGYWLRSMKERDVFIAALDGRDAGSVVLNWQPQYSLYRKLDIPEIQDLHVVPDARRRGIGAALIAHCENLIREDGHTQAGISVGLHGAFGAAQRLYVRLGYMPDGNGITYERQPVSAGDRCAVDDDLCLMMVKDL